MSLRVIGLSLAVILGFHVSGVHAASEHPTYYLSLYGGWAYPAKFSGVEGGDALPGQSFDDFELRDGLMFGGKLGFEPGRDFTWINFEIEYFWHRPDFKQQTVSGTAFNGSNTYIHTVAANIILRRHQGFFQPYVGFGLGPVFARTANLYPAGTVGAGSATDVSLGLNFLAGLRLMPTDRLGLFVEAKHNRTGLEFAAVNGRYEVSTGVAGLVLHFDDFGLPLP